MQGIHSVQGRPLNRWYNIFWFDLIFTHIHRNVLHLLTILQSFFTCVSANCSSKVFLVLSNWLHLDSNSSTCVTVTSTSFWSLTLKSWSSETLVSSSVKRILASVTCASKVLILRSLSCFFSCRFFISTLNSDVCDSKFRLFLSRLSLACLWKKYN